MQICTVLDSLSPSNNESKYSCNMCYCKISLILLVPGWPVGLSRSHPMSIKFCSFHYKKKDYDPFSKSWQKSGGFVPKNCHHRLSKVAQMLGNFLGYLESVTFFKYKLLWLFFFVEISLLLGQLLVTLVMNVEFGKSLWGCEAIFVWIPQKQNTKIE